MAFVIYCEGRVVRCDNDIDFQKLVSKDPENFSYTGFNDLKVGEKCNHDWSAGSYILKVYDLCKSCHVRDNTVKYINSVRSHFCKTCIDLLMEEYEGRKITIEKHVDEYREPHWRTMIKTIPIRKKKMGF